MAYKVCYNCKEENLEHSSVCSRCSHSLHHAKTYGIPNNEKPHSSPKPKYCSNCNEKLDIDSLKCKYCGQMTISAPSTSSSRIYYSSTSSDSSAAIILLYIATFFIPIVGIIVGGFYALNDDPDKSSVGKGLIVFGLVMIVIEIILWNIVF